MAEPAQQTNFMYANYVDNTQYATITFHSNRILAYCACACLDHFRRRNTKTDRASKTPSQLEQPLHLVRHLIRRRVRRCTLRRRHHLTRSNESDGKRTRACAQTRPHQKCSHFAYSNKKHHCIFLSFLFLYVYYFYAASY